MPDFSDIPDEAVEAAHDISWGGEQANRHHIRMMLAAALPVLNTAKDSETATAIERMAAEFRTVLHKDPAYTYGSLAWRLMNDIDAYAASLRGEQGE